nr:immunoglobulin heavy chain junction region [Macaca mulatta]MOY18280.1 immunoglobulin heavy chain junction region [Macaca mulatta]MOY18289.1 immunoglobulin heavy chain junction region [Macaca mulatta]MOY18615.1 immunoglobulin heavy chain junction region [Macaca mulatta]MOY18776.1 immunoglobulin heavy chain junction region [Macaca mulatta]
CARCDSGYYAWCYFDYW